MLSYVPRRLRTMTMMTTTRRTAMPRLLTEQDEWPYISFGTHAARHTHPHTHTHTYTRTHLQRGTQTQHTRIQRSFVASRTEHAYTYKDVRCRMPRAVPLSNWFRHASCHDTRDSESTFNKRCAWPALVELETKRRQHMFPVVKMFQCFDLSPDANAFRRLQFRTV